jgi:hypothetical protein
MKRVNLIQYPKFWIDINARINKYIGPGAAVGSHHIKLWMKEWYGINVYVMPSTIAGEVYMLETDYIAFVLRWA